MYTADNICNMIEFLIDNIFVQFGGHLFHQVIGIPVGTNCVPLLADPFLYSYENEFLHTMIKSWWGILQLFYYLSVLEPMKLQPDS